jgi:hypothetical protein
MAHERESAVTQLDTNNQHMKELDTKTSELNKVRLKRAGGAG